MFSGGSCHGWAAMKQHQFEYSHPEYLTINGLSAYLNIKPKTLYARIGEIPHYKVGRLVRFRKDEIDAWMQKHRVGKEEVKEPVTTASGCFQEAPAARKPQKRRVSGPLTDIDRMISKAIDHVKGEGYTPSHGKSDQVKGSGKEV